MSESDQEKRIRDVERDIVRLTMRQKSLEQTIKEHTVVMESGFNGMKEIFLEKLNSIKDNTDRVCMDVSRNVSDIAELRRDTEPIRVAKGYPNILKNAIVGLMIVYGSIAIGLFFTYQKFFKPMIEITQEGNTHDDSNQNQN